MVAPSSFDSPISALATTIQTGSATRSDVARNDAQRLDSRPETAARESGPRTGFTQEAPIRGDRPISQTLSTPFVAQFIAQEIDPRPSRPSDPVETSRAFEAFRQAITNAERSDDRNI